MTPRERAKSDIENENMSKRKAYRSTRGLGLTGEGTTPSHERQVWVSLEVKPIERAKYSGGAGRGAEAQAGVLGRRCVWSGFHDVERRGVLQRTEQGGGGRGKGSVWGEGTAGLRAVRKPEGGWLGSESK